MKLTQPTMASAIAFGAALASFIASAIKADVPNSYAAQIFETNVENSATMLHFAGPGVALTFAMHMPSKMDDAHSAGYLISGLLEISGKDINDDLAYALAESGFTQGTISAMASKGHGTDFNEIGTGPEQLLIQILGAGISPTILDVSTGPVDISKAPDVMSLILASIKTDQTTNITDATFKDGAADPEIVTSPMRHAETAQMAAAMAGNGVTTPQMGDGDSADSGRTMMAEA